MMTRIRKTFRAADIEGAIKVYVGRDLDVLMSVLTHPQHKLARL